MKTTVIFFYKKYIHEKTIQGFCIPFGLTGRGEPLKHHDEEFIRKLDLTAVKITKAYH